MTHDTLHLNPEGCAPLSQFAAEVFAAVQADQVAAIIAAATDLLSELDVHAQDQEPNPGQRACMERLRAALAE